MKGLFVGYLAEREASDTAEGTINIYFKYLSRFADGCDAAGVTIDQLDRATVNNFLVSLGGPTARNTALSALRGFLSWCVRSGYMNRDTMEAALDGRKYNKVARRRKHFIPVAQFRPMLTLAEAEHPWNRAVLGVALFTLCRQSELAAITFKDVDLAARVLHVWREKRDRWTKTPIGPDLKDELDTWLAWYAKDQDYPSPAAMMAAHPDWYLLPAKRGSTVQGAGGRMVAGPVTIMPTRRSRSLETVVKSILDALGTDGTHGLSVRHLGEGMHTIRRSGAMALFRQLDAGLGRDRAIFQVGAMLDHEEPRVMTPKYLDLDTDRDEVHDFILNNRMYEPSLADTMPARTERHLAVVR